MKDDLKWWQWLTLTARETQVAGFDPHQRFNKIGHRRPLSPRWCLTIGMWGLKSANEIMAATGISPGVDQKNTQRGTYDVFKHRHRLLAGPQFARMMATLPDKDKREKPEGGWNQCHLATTAYVQSRILMGEIHRPFCGEVIDTVRLRLHILPIEVYLYYDAIEFILAEHGLTRATWVNLSPEMRLEYWNTALREDGPMVVECPEELRYAHAHKKEQDREEAALVH